MTQPLSGKTPHQIDNVVGVDRMDTIDRQGLHPLIKFKLLAEETKATYGRDPRSGGFSFVGRPRVILAVMKDFWIKNITKLNPYEDLRLQKPVIMGDYEADLVAWWCDIPIVVRSCVVDDKIHCVPSDQIPGGKMLDRRQAGRIRLAAVSGKIEDLED